MQNTAATAFPWKTAETSVYIHIVTQLEHCQRAATTGLFCDLAGIGKSYAGKDYAKSHQNAIYLDCSLYKSKQLFIRALAEAFGIPALGKYHHVKQALISAIKHSKNPLFILDEAGDLDYPAFLEIKALYNATEEYCGWYMMGAQGLEAKMEAMRFNRKVGYEEIYDRFGARYQSVTEDMDAATRALMLRHQATAILKANMPGLSKAQSDEILNACELNLRRLRKEIIKAKKPELNLV